MSADVGSDWHVRKRWYTRFCEVALFKLKKPELMYELMRNRQVGPRGGGGACVRGGCARAASSCKQPWHVAHMFACMHACARVRLRQDGVGHQAGRPFTQAP